MKTLIPNTITLGNLFCGVMASYMAAFGRIEEAVIFILCGALLDFFDGFAARLLNVESALGKELDSLADEVTSGIAPGFILFSILWNHSESTLLKYVAFLIPVFTAYRLARYNNDKDQHQHFKGLPAPANAIFWSGVGLWFYDMNMGLELIPTWHATDAWNNMFGFLFTDNGYLCLALLSLVSNLLLVSRVPMFSLKFANMKWRDNRVRYLFLIISAALLVCFGVVSLPAVIVVYIVLSLCTAKSFR